MPRDADAILVAVENERLKPRRFLKVPAVFLQTQEENRVNSMWRDDTNWAGGWANSVSKTGPLNYIKLMLYTAD